MHAKADRFSIRSLVLTVTVYSDHQINKENSAHLQRNQRGFSRTVRRRVGIYASQEQSRALSSDFFC